jgi:hypothetical protein
MAYGRFVSFSNTHNMHNSQGHHRIFVVDPAKAHSVTVSGNTVVINIKVGWCSQELARATLPQAD